MDIMGQFIGKWKDAGYQAVRVSIWHGTRLFVNLDSYPAFCYQLDKKGPGRSCRISSQELLPSRVFNDARKLGYFVSEHKALLAHQAKEQAALKRKEQKQGKEAGKI